MALQPLSIGDILMLSQTAWKIGRAFTQGKKSAPSEFAEVEREANGLSESLKLVAEALHEDGSILAEGKSGTKNAVYTILESAKTTLEDLESFVERYMVIKKREVDKGFVVERTWSEVVVANYKTFKWTTEGGDIKELRNMLAMHTNTINLTMQALQSKSLSRLEKTVMPMAENIASIHDRVNGDLGDKIDDLHHIIMTIASSTPSLVARDRRLSASSARDSTGTVSTIERSPAAETRLLEPPPARPPNCLPPRLQSLSPRVAVAKLAVPSDATPGLRSAAKNDPAFASSASSVHENEKIGRKMDWDFESGSPVDVRGSIGEHVDRDAGASPHDSAYAGPSRRASSRPESMTIPSLFRAVDQEYHAVGGSSRKLEPGSGDPDLSPSNLSPKGKRNSWRSSSGVALLPPPAIPDEDEQAAQPATPSSIFSSLQRTKSNADESPSTVRSPTSRSANRLDSHANGLPERPTFERQLFRNAAILCDIRGKTVEYAWTNPDEPDPRFQTEMKEACKESRICVIRKKENREHGGTRIVTSVWCLSDDGEVRMQQKLSDLEETVPYCSYFDPEKVSLPPNGTKEIALKFHAEQWGAMLKEEIKTTWTNYIFASEGDANAFQSAVFGRTLLGSFRTTKTTVIHEGLKGAFAFEEQFANIEMLRLWEEDGTMTPGAQGGVLALMHISSNFGEGWAKWWINNSKQQVKIKEDGGKYAKVKGIDVTVVRPGGSATQAQKEKERARTASFASEELPYNRFQAKNSIHKKVGGIRIEFKSEDERLKFVAKAKKCQERPIPLPELM